MEQVHDVSIVCQARSSGRMRNDMLVTGSWAKATPWSLATDEGAFHGGEGSAPPPLALFAAAVTGCFMTQLRAFAKKMRITIDGVTVEASYRWRMTVPTGGLYHTAPSGFGLDIDIVSSASFEDLKELIAAAKQGCFLEQTLGVANVIDHRLNRDGEWIDV